MCADLLLNRACSLHNRTEGTTADKGGVAQPWPSADKALWTLSSCQASLAILAEAAADVYPSWWVIGLYHGTLRMLGCTCALEGGRSWHRLFRKGRSIDIIEETRSSVT